jgi:hypothetical protein
MKMSKFFINDFWFLIGKFKKNFIRKNKMNFIRKNKMNFIRKNKMDLKKIWNFKNLSI